MTFAEKNTLARTGFLGLLTCVLMALAVQGSDVLKDAQQDEHGIAVQGSDLLASAKGFIPAQPLDVAKFYTVMQSAVDLLNAGKQQVDATGPTIKAATSFVQKLGVSADKFNVPCPANDDDKLHPCGTLADVAKTLNTGRHTLGEIEIGVHNFDTHEDSLFLQEQQTWAKANTAIDSANTLFSDSDFKTIAAHIATGTGTFNHMLETGDKVETKVTKCTLEPTFVCKFTGWLLPTAQITGALLH